MPCIVDTNVVLSGLRSRRGASFRLIERIEQRRIVPAVTVPLVLECEDVLLRPGVVPDLSPKEVADFIDWWVSVSQSQVIHFLWRPYLPDPKDDMLLEAAVAVGARHIVSFNHRHLKPCAKFGIRPISPADYLTSLKL